MGGLIKFLPMKGLAFLAAVLGIMVYAGLYGLNQQEEVRRGEVGRVLDSIAQLKVVEVERWRSDSLMEAQMVASSPTLSVLATLADKPYEDEQRKQLEDLVRNYLFQAANAYNFSNIRILDADNQVLLSLIGGVYGGLSPETQDVVRRARVSDTAQMGDFYLLAGDSPVIDVAVPIQGEQGRNARNMIIVFELNPYEQLYPMLLSWPVPSETAESLLIRVENKEVVYLSDLRFQLRSALHMRRSQDEKKLASVMAGEGSRGVFIGEDYRGQSVIARIAAIADSDWFIESKIDVSEAFAAQRHEKQLGLIALIIALVSISTAFLLLWIWRTSKQQEALLAAEDRIAAQQARMASVFNLSAIGIMRGERFTLAGKGLSELIGYSSEELANLSMRALYHPPEDYDRVAAEIKRQLTLSSAGATDAVWLKKNGSLLEVVICVTRSGDDDREIGIAVIDNSAKKKRERALERHRHELERSNRELSTFAYVASHDLRSPLRGISQISSWIVEDMDETAASPAIKEHLRLMKSRIKRMEALLDDLLTYSRIGRIEGDRKQVDVGDLCRKTFAMVAHPPTFTLRLADDLPVFKTLELPFSQVLENLFDNAVKHHSRPDGEVAVSSEIDGAFYVFTIKDDGPGIPPEFHEKIFELFETLRPRDEVEGSGMGLALVKKTIEIYEGRIEVQSDGVNGAAFRFWWPTEGKMQEILDARDGE